jgi:hypothetical protein
MSCCACLQILQAIQKEKAPETDITASVLLVVAGCVMAGIGDFSFDLKGYVHHAWHAHSCFSAISCMQSDTQCFHVVPGTFLRCSAAGCKHPTLFWWR